MKHNNCFSIRSIVSKLLACFTLSYVINFGHATRQLTLDIMKSQTKLLLKRVWLLQNVIKDYKTPPTNLSIPTATPHMELFYGCNELYKAGYSVSGVYMIHVFHGFYTIPIYCDMATTGAFSGERGWMIIQKRMNGLVNFDRGWNDYLQGFGFPDQEHWIGLRNILRIMEQKIVGKYDNQNLMLRIDVEDWDGNTAFMEHSSFSILSEEYDFEIHGLGKYEGTPGLRGPFEFSHSSPFSTFDHNKNSGRDDACLKSQRGGWWFGFCANMNLNGIYSKRKEIMTKEKIFIKNWRAVNENNTSLRYVSIKLQ